MQIRTSESVEGDKRSMRTQFKTPEEAAVRFLEIANNRKPYSNIRPERFIQIMKSHKGTLIDANPLDEQGIPKRNPVIAVLGDSVTAGHFEWLIDVEVLKAQAEAFAGAETGTAEAEPEKVVAEQEIPPIEVTDARESYIEKFREKLIDKYEQTSVSVINAGIAGDDLRGMQARLQRDVISHAPDLVLINGALNWSEQLGTTAEYKEILRKMVREIKEGTQADIILITPNGALPGPFAQGPDLLEERVRAIRKIAAEEETGIADHYAVWEEFRKQGYDWKDLLANGVNHPSITGHEGYAVTLMKVLED